MNKHDLRARGINTASTPSGNGCVECLASEGWWFHLRRCAECGHIGCCDSSPSQHASAHAQSTGHRVTASFEPGENWFYDYKTDENWKAHSYSRRTRIQNINQFQAAKFPAIGSHC